MRRFLPVIGIVLSLFNGVAALAYEEPAYKVVETFPEFEVRQYEPYVVAETYVSGPFEDVGSEAFRRLFAYISEDKRPQGKIAMTTPVIQQPETQNEALQKDSDGTKDSSGRYRFAFVMPSTYTLEDLPIPENVEVQLREIPARLVAVRKYSGTWSEERYRTNEMILIEEVVKHGFEIVSEPIFARYNAPFSLWFLRRNEVLMDVKKLEVQNK